MKRVVVVESGAKTQTIRAFLGGEYDVVASGGHIVDLPKGELAIDVEGDFSYTLEPIRRRGGDAVEALCQKLDGADEVYLATDPDREGEAIAADIRDRAVPAGSRVQRISFNAIVYPVVKEALENPREVDEDRVQAQRARRILDRLIGFILSPIAKFDPDGPQLPSVGRVQSPAVRLVVDREREIDAFEVRRYWTVAARVSADGAAFDVGVTGDWDDFEDAKAVVDELGERETFAVESCEVDERSEQNPLPPYATDSLQTDADFLLDLSPERTMELAQQLYEGVDLDDGEGSGRKALITYMRTDSTRVSPSALNLAKETLAKREDLGEALYKGRTWQTGGGAQDAHEAIRPTHPEDPDLWPENLEGRLDERLLQLYRLIYARFLASQMAPAVYRTTEFRLASGPHQAEAVGHELLEPGFLTVWREVRPDAGRDEVALPTLERGAELPLERVWPEPQETRPPARYREGSLVGELKDRGIGRPSTYGDILRKIKRSEGFGYVRKSGKTLRPTEKGEALVDFLAERFPNAVDYEYTARMESDLDRIEAGELGYTEYLEGEFRWLADPYRTARERGWMDADRPTVRQLEFLDSLADETDTDVPEDVYESKEEVGAWIDRLQDEIQPTLRITDIHEADAGGVPVFRFRVYCNRPVPDEVHDRFKDLGLKYKGGNQDRPPGYQFQRQDRSVVEERRERALRLCREHDALEEYGCEDGGEL